MRDEIIARQNDPRVLEQMYPINKSAFKREFISLYPKLSARSITGFWHERLNFDKEDVNWGMGRDLLFVISAS